MCIACVFTTRSLAFGEGVTYATCPFRSVISGQRIASWGDEQMQETIITNTYIIFTANVLKYAYQMRKYKHE